MVIFGFCMGILIRFKQKKAMKAGVMPGLPSGVMKFPLQAIHVIQDRHCCLVVYCKASDIANLSKQSRHDTCH